MNHYRLSDRNIFKLRGSYTLELSLLMPVIIGVIIAVMYLCIYIHDKLVMESNIIACILSEEMSEVSDNSLLDLENRINRSIDNSLIYDWECLTQLYNENDYVVVIVKASRRRSNDIAHNYIRDRLSSFEIVNLYHGKGENSES